MERIVVKDKVKYKVELSYRSTCSWVISLSQCLPGKRKYQPMFRLDGDDWDFRMLKMEEKVELRKKEAKQIVEFVNELDPTLIDSMQQEFCDNLKKFEITTEMWF